MSPDELTNMERKLLVEIAGAVLAGRGHEGFASAPILIAALKLPPTTVKRALAGLRRKKLITRTTRLRTTAWVYTPTDEGWDLVDAACQ